MMKATAVPIIRGPSLAGARGALPTSEAIWSHYPTSSSQLLTEELTIFFVLYMGRIMFQIVSTMTEGSPTGCGSIQVPSWA